MIPRPILRCRFHRSAALAVTLAALGAFSLPGPAWARTTAAQEEDPDPGAPLEAVSPTSDSLQLLDGVAAIVGDTVVLLSEVQQELLRLEAQGARVPPAGSPQRDQLAVEIINAITDRLLLLQEATRAGLTLPEQQVDGYVEQLFQQRRDNFSSDEEFQRAVEGSGLNMFQFRQQLRSQARAEILLQQYRQRLRQQGDLPPASVSDAEVRRYFEENRGQERRPATVSFSRLLVAPRATAEADSAARATIRQAMEELRAGEPFEVVARRHSEDPASREQGGDMGWMRQDQVVPAFGDVAWSAQASRGTPIGPVETRFGYHIIRVENTRGGERHLRHILVRPEIGEERVEQARRRAEALADSLRAGTPIDSLVDAPGVISDERERTFEHVPLDEIASGFGRAYREAIGRPETGEVAGPFRVEGAQGTPQFAVLKVDDYRAPGEWRLEDVEANIRDRLRTQKRLDAYLEMLRRRAYIEILI